MHVQHSEVLGKIGRRYATNGAGGIHNAQEPECTYRIFRHFVLQGQVKTRRRFVLVSKTLGRGPFFHIEEYCIEPKEQKANPGCEPAETRLPESVPVNENPSTQPALRLAHWMEGVRSSKEDCKQGGASDDSGNAAYSIVEPYFADEELRHDWIHQACDTCAGSDNANNEWFLANEPCCDDWSRLVQSASIEKPLALTLRTGHEEATHTKARDQTLREPNETVVAVVVVRFAIGKAQHEHAYSEQSGTRYRKDSDVASI